MKIEKETVSFLVLGQPKSGKTTLTNRIGGISYSSKPVENNYVCRNWEIKNNTVQFIFWDLKEIPNYKSIANVILLTVDMTDKEGLTKASDQINDIRIHTNKPIILIGTKSDEVVREKITEKQLKEFATLHAQNSVFGPLITSVRENKGIDDNFFKSVYQIAIDKDPDLKSKRPESSQTIKDQILPELEKYTSRWNKFLAYLKAIVSLGFFRLGVKKQDKAEALKAKLNQPDADADQLVKTYKEENEKLVLDEIKDSRLFIKSYVKQQPSGEVKGNHGELGNILNKTTSPENK